MTSPAELPIVGDPESQIQLDAVFPQNRQLFRLDGKRLRLLQPIDRDSANVSHVVFQVGLYIFYLQLELFSCQSLSQHI